MPRPALLWPCLCLVAACVADPSADASLPLPPPQLPPPAARAPRRAPLPAEVAATAEPAPAAHEEEEVLAAAPPPVAAAAAPAPSAGWHVVRDGVVGCADRLSLAVLGGETRVTPRAMAEARAAGGCRTTFRVNEWVAEAIEGNTVQLRLTNGAALTLWFRRSDLTAP